MDKYILYNKKTKKVKAIASKEPSLKASDKLGYKKFLKSELEMDKFNIGYSTTIKNGKIVYVKKRTQADISLDLKTELNNAKSLEEVKSVVEKLL